LKRFLVVIDPLDLRLLVLWIVSTHLALELYTTPRLLLDSSMLRRQRLRALVLGSACRVLHGAAGVRSA
jgi:hypothetical protein